MMRLLQSTDFRSFESMVLFLPPWISIHSQVVFCFLSMHLCLFLFLACFWFECSETDNEFSIGENENVGTKLTVGGGGRDKGGNTHTGNKPGSIYFTDPDLEDTHTFRIISLDDHDAFSLNAKTGKLSLKKAVDFEFTPIDESIITVGNLYLKQV